MTIPLSMAAVQDQLDVEDGQHDKYPRCSHAEVWTLPSQGEKGHPRLWSPADGVQQEA